MCEYDLCLATVENYRIACAPLTFSILQNSFHIKHVRQAHIIQYVRVRTASIIEIPNFAAPEVMSRVGNDTPNPRDESQKSPPERLREVNESTKIGQSDKVKPTLANFGGRNLVTIWMKQSQNMQSSNNLYKINCKKFQGRNLGMKNKFPALRSHKGRKKEHLLI